MPLKKSPSRKAFQQNLKAEVAAYFAGIVDGEGCIGFTKIRGNLVPRLSVTNTDLRLLRTMRRRFGGRIASLSRTGAGWKRAYAWVVTSAAAARFADIVEPFLLLKREQVWLFWALDAIRPGKGRAWDDEGRDACDLLNRQSKWLNRRGDGRPRRSPIDSTLSLYATPLFGGA